MNNEEAIKKIEELADCCNYEIIIDSEDVEALNKAIEALKTLDNNTAILDEKSTNKLLDIIEEKE